MSTPNCRIERPPEADPELLRKGRPSRVIELKGVGLRYQLRGKQSFWALRDLNLSIRRGETLGVIGRNGAGKTSLLRILAGILRPDEGVCINHGRQTTLLSLKAGFLQNLSGRQNATLNGMLLGMTWGQVRRALDGIVSFADLGEFVDQPIRTYSSGMLARLGFAVAVHADPDVLLIDETLGVGDLDFLRKSQSAMKEKIRSNKTVVLVSHQAKPIRQLCDRAVWIDQGKLRQEGLPEEILRAFAQSS